MLQLKEICKEYHTGELVQKALDGISLNLRDNEFVAILGPSGSGKTTLLNIVGGLDRYDSGELIINGISTQKYKDRDWDSYRNHTIGFVFQSYNLIPHQTILSNVELALTISGISKGERKKRAQQALDQVGLGDQVHKKPNQLSGGQMQRVAIARALVNNPDILLADEPTGALDTETSIQVMELLKEVAKDRLVVMVTHNPELAEQYATRIVKLRDGRITDDSDPYVVDSAGLAPAKHENMGKSSMSFLTSLSLSFNNLRTKKARTILTSFAGSIGIIGIALILSLSNGVNLYIADIQKETMTSYPISIQAQSMDLSSILQAGAENMESYGNPDHGMDEIYSNSTDFEMASSFTTSITENNLTAFKKYLDDPSSEIHQYVGENGITYSYDPQFDIYTYDSEGTLVNTDGSTLQSSNQTSTGMVSGMAQMMPNESNHFEELMPNADGESISPAVTNSYDMLYGSWPQAYNEVVLVVDRNNEISANTLFELGLMPTSQYRELMAQLDDGQEVTLDTQSWSYEDLCGKTFYLIPACDYYQEGDNGLYQYVGDNTTQVEGLLEDALQLKVTGIIRPKEDAQTALMSGTFGYTRALTNYLIDTTDNSPVVQAQAASPEVNILTGTAFAPADDAAKVEDTRNYLNNLSTRDKADLYRNMLSAIYADDTQSLQMMLTLEDTQLVAIMDQALLSSQDPEDERLLAIYEAYLSAGSYDENMSTFGVVSLDAPSSIEVYTDSFEDKESITDCIEAYNATVPEEDQITYTDYVGLLMSSVTTIVNVISYVLVAFVSVSLVVSSIMIGIITYISVLERTKEIGILRSIGASKRNISQLFNAETFLIGLCAGLIGIGVTLLLLIPGNAVIHSLAGTTDVNATLPMGSAALLVLLSMVLTMISGLIPARKAANRDPVTALRTE